MRALALVAASLALCLAGPAWSAPGKALAPCAGCHPLNGVKKKIAGPSLVKIYGAKPLKSAIKVAKWDDKALDRYLWNPERVDPTTRMFFKVRDAKKRAEIIAALKILK